MVLEESPLYRDLMRFKPDGWSANAWAVAAGVNRTVWTDIRRHGNPSRRTLEKLLSVAGSSLAEFEALRIGDTQVQNVSGDPSRLADAARLNWSGAALPPLPLVATAPGGVWADGVDLIVVRMDSIIAQLPRPASLAGDPAAYALTIVGDAMWPRFRPGRNVAVSPKDPVTIGDDVLVMLADGTTAMVQEMAARTAGHVELRQFNPARTFPVDTSEIGAMHKIVGELI